jgi:regulatory protein
MMARPPLSLKGRALRLLSGREYSRAQLQRKLAPFEEEPGALAAVLDDLQAKDFINEGRVIESVVHRRASKLGAQRVKQELQATGVDPQAIAQAVQDLRASELDRARQVWRKKFTSPPSSPAERAKHMRFLASRGFMGDTIARVLGSSDHEVE